MRVFSGREEYEYVEVEEEVLVDEKVVLLGLAVDQSCAVTGAVAQAR